MSLILYFLIIISLVVLAIKWRKKSKILSLLLISPIIIILCLIGFVVYNSWYYTSPDSITMSVENEKQTYILNGEWVKPLDFYRFSTDFIVFYIPNNTKLSNVIRNTYQDYSEMDYKDLETNIQQYLIEVGAPNLPAQIFDIEASKKFQFRFDLPTNLKREDITAYYVHIREEPMDSLEFWYKEIEFH